MAIETSDLIVDPDSVVDHWPDLDLVLKYWRGKARGTTIPGRDDIDPMDLAEILPQMNLIDVVSQPEGHFRYRHRLEGTMLEERFKRSSTGAWFDDNYDPAHLSKQIVAYDDAVHSKKPNLARIQVVTDDHYEIDYTRLIMPLAADGESVDMLLVVFSFNKYDSSSSNILPIHQSQTVNDGPV